MHNISKIILEKDVSFSFRLQSAGNIELINAVNNNNNHKNDLISSVDESRSICKKTNKITPKKIIIFFV